MGSFIFFKPLIEQVNCENKLVLNIMLTEAKNHRETESETFNLNPIYFLNVNFNKIMQLLVQQQVWYNVLRVA